MTDEINTSIGTPFRALLHLVEAFLGLLGFSNGSVFCISYSKPNACMYLLERQSFRIMLPSYVINTPRVHKIYSQLKFAIRKLVNEIHLYTLRG